MKTLAEEISVYRPAVALEKILARPTQSILRFIFFFLALSFGIVGFFGAAFLPEIPTTLWWGAALLNATLWVDQLLTFGYHNNYYFRGLASVDASKTMVTYDVAALVLTHEDDVTRAFCESSLGRNILLRTRIMPNTISAFLTASRRTIAAAAVTLPEGQLFTIRELGTYLLQHDTAFANIFTTHGIDPLLFVKTLDWIVGTQHTYKRSLRWWSKENLSKTTGIGREWSYGTPYTLERYTRNKNTTAIFSTLTTNPTLAAEKISAIEEILAKEKGGNVLLLGEAGVGKMDLVLAVEKRSQTGIGVQAILNKRFYVLDTNRLFASHQSKTELEQTLLTLFAEAANAGNSIVVIENISTVIQEAEQVGVFLPALLDEFLAFPDLHIIATDTPQAYHQILEPLGAFTRRFSEVQVDSTDQTATTRVLASIALSTEQKQRIIFSYESLEAITAAADRYLVEGVMPDKAINLLLEVAAAAAAREQILITADFVYQLVAEKTTIPVGPIQATERDRLLRLEEILHQSVIGQTEAIAAIAKTMRRARTGLQASDKPIGSFLFLGPTGVGKTETAKALATVFFGSPEKMERLDMSEYNGGDAVYRLIGDGATSGALADRLREHPYTVLLLDEFEKANPAVHDLFLQILDEGVFTDGRGSVVNARNTIIIATSNAGAEVIMKTVQERKELRHLSEEIIAYIIRTGIFKPELLNRFDNTIIFEPLTKSEQRQVASLLLGELYERTAAKGYHLALEDTLLDLLVEKGYDPAFGARPMRRVLQDIIEEKVATLIISGQVERGDTITLGPNDFSATELAK